MADRARNEVPAMPSHFPPPPRLPQKAALFRQVPPAVFPPILGLLGLGIAWRRGAHAFGVPGAAVELALGAISLLFLFAATAYMVKLMLRGPVFYEDLATLPGRTGLAAMTMAVMLLAAVLVPYMPATAAILLALGFLAHLWVAAVVGWRLVREPGAQGPVTPAMHLVFVGFIVAPAAAVPLGVPQGAILALVWYCALVSLVLWAVTLAPLLRRAGTPPLRPLHAIHLAPAALLASALFLLGQVVAALAFLSLATALFILLMLRARWMTEAGFSGFWSAFTFPVAAFAGALSLAHQAVGGEWLRVGGGLVLVFATLMIPPIALKVMQMWAKGTLAARTNAAVA
jgi:tellurite resistance protein